MSTAPLPHMLILAVVAELLRCGGCTLAVAAARSSCGDYSSKYLLTMSVRRLPASLRQETCAASAPGRQSSSHGRAAATHGMHAALHLIHSTLGPAPELYLQVAAELIAEAFYNCTLHPCNAYKGSSLRQVYRRVLFRTLLIFLSKPIVPLLCIPCGHTRQPYSGTCNTSGV